jgi:TATA-box binding protein (TBP) (component of TFIID and TFIIIB)
MSLHDQQVSSVFGNISYKYKHYLKEKPYVTSMTTVFKTNLSDCGRISEPELLFMLTNSAFRPFSQNIKTKVNKKKPGAPSFLNCNFLSISGYASKITGRVFTNGTLHITGCREKVIADKVATQICDALSIASKRKIEIISSKIVMINSSLAFYKYVLLKNAFIKMRNTQQSNVNIFYEEERSKGLKFVIFASPSRKITIFVFKSGSIVATGMQTGAELMTGITIVLDELIKVNKDPTIVTHNKPVKTKKVNESDKLAMFDNLAALLA